MGRRPAPFRSDLRRSAAATVAGGPVGGRHTADLARVWQLDRSDPLPLWAQLLADLRQRLERGEFSSAFPSELELAASYSVSRNTVREAVRRLRSEGIIVAGRGRRPLPAGGAVIEQPLGALYSLFRSVEAAGMPQRSVVRALEMCTNVRVALALGLEADAKLFHLERLRLAAEEPLALDHVWCPAELGAALLDVDFTRTAFYDELARRGGVQLTGGEEHLHAVVPNSQERRLLAIDAGTAALAIDRTGFMRDRPVERRETLVRGDRFSVIATFSAGLGYRLDLAGAGEGAPSRHPGAGRPS